MCSILPLFEMRFPRPARLPDSQFRIAAVIAGEAARETRGGGVGLVGTDAETARKRFVSLRTPPSTPSFSGYGVLGLRGLVAGGLQSLNWTGLVLHSRRRSRTAVQLCDRSGKTDPVQFKGVFKQGPLCL